MNNKPFILALCIGKDSRGTLPFMVASIKSWITKIVYVDDHSSDGSVELMKDLFKKDKDQLDIQYNNGQFSLLGYEENKRDVSNEQKIRNYWIDYCFDNYSPDALILIDTDEIMSNKLLDYVVSNVEKDVPSLALECNHLLSKSDRLNVYPQIWNGVKMIDPHVRVLFKRQHYIPGEWPESPDCFLKQYEKTVCVDYPLHFHLHYLPQFNRKNYAFKNLPEYIDVNNAGSYCESLPPNIPRDVELLINSIIK